MEATPDGEPDRRIVLTDFGVAHVLGTPAFMAPEQAENAAASPAADLWSLGAVLFNAVEGRPPFQGPDHATVLLTLLTQEAPALVNGGPLKPLIAALLVKDPERRPTAEETAALSANGRYAVCGASSFVRDGDDDVIVWDIENNQQVAAWPGATWVYGLALSPDGKKVIFSDKDDTTLQVWDVASHRQTGSLAVGVSSSKNALAFSPDGSRLAVPSPGVDGVIELWNVSKEKKVAAFRGGDGGSTMAFSADGDRLVAANDDSGAVWNARSGRKLASWSE